MRLRLTLFGVMLFLCGIRFESTDAYQHLSKPFHRITYAEALTLLQSSSKVFKKPPVYGEDIQREHEHVSCITKQLL